MATREIRILGLGHALPPHRYEQSEMTALVRDLFRSDRERVDRLLPAFVNTTIEQRNLARPREWYSDRKNGFAEANEAYREVAVDIGEAAARAALAAAGRTADSVGAIVVVSSTGLATPSLDALLVPRLGLSPHVRRLPIWGLGCAGGVSGLARSRELLASLPADRTVLCVVVEVCSLTLQRDDVSLSNLIGTGLFADGAAAAVLGTGCRGPAVGDGFSVLFPGTGDIMGWDVVAGGLKVRFSRSIPEFVAAHARDAFDSAREAWDLERSALRHVVTHPGGPKVMRALAEALDLEPDALASAAVILRRHGNMSSPTVLFVLEEFLATVPADGGEGSLFALGPGFSAEFLRFRHDGGERA